MLKILQALLRPLLRLLFRVQVRGLEHYPHREQRLLIVANHTSFLDGMLLSVFLPEVPVFVINARMARRWWVIPFIRLTRHIDIDPTSPLYLKVLIQQLKDDKRVAIFPEGRITVTGSLMKVYEGPAVAADHAKALLLPVHIQGAQYSFLSRLQGVVRRRLLPAIRLTILPPHRLEPPQGLDGRSRRRWLGQRLDKLMTELAYRGARIDRSLFEALVEAKTIHGGGKVILEDPQHQPLNYRQLITRSFVLARLLEEDCGGQRRVGMLLPNANGMVVLFWALQLSGRVPVILNFTLGARGLTSACRGAEVSTVYTARAFIEGAGLEGTVAQLGAEGLKVVQLEDLRSRVTPALKLQGLWRSLRPLSHYRRLAGAVVPEDAGVILFTSGSEGNPKGVMLTHRNLQANAAQVLAMLDITPRDVMFNALPLFHSFGLSTGTLLPLLCGVKTFLYPSPLHYHVIPELVYQQCATIMLGTSTFLSGYARAADPYDFFRVRLAVAGAEPLRMETRRQWLEKFGIRIIEGYGVTEASPVLAANTPKHHRAGSVGRLVPGVEYYLEPVEGIQQGGRLCVRGDSIMAGYLDAGRPSGLRPPATGRGEGWYDTGDIVTVDEGGFVTIQGRAKRFAKIGGEMVSLAAVEELAQSVWPDQQHAAINVPDPAKGEHIVLLTTRQDASRQDLVKGIHERNMGELFVPRRVQSVAQLPLLGSGKVDYAMVRTLASNPD